MPSSSSSGSSNSSPAPTRKRKHVEADSSDSSAPDESSADEDTPQPQPLVTEESTVLSHAERRRQKKRERQLLAAASSETPRKKRKLPDETATTKPKTKTTTTPAAGDPTRQRRQNSVWVGNLPFRTTQDAVRGFFDGAGTITRIHMPMRHGKQGENMGFAYVDFDTPEAKVIAITLSEGQLDGRNLLIKDGGDFTGRPIKSRTDTSEAGGGGEGGGAQGDEKVAKKGVGAAATTADGKGLSKTAQKILRAQKQPPAPTLFLGNLGFETTEASIRELFEAHRYWRCKGKDKGMEMGAEEQEVDEGEGEGKDKPKDVWIRKIRMGTFEDSGNCKGFAFVDFTSIEHATAALVNPRNHRLNGRDLVVEYASPDAVRRGGGPRKTKGDQSARTVQKGPSVNVLYTKQRRPRHGEQEGDIDIAAETTTRSRRLDRAGRDRPHTRRAKPGAALAHAERQSAAILPGQGQKIVF